MSDKATGLLHDGKKSGAASLYNRPLALWTLCAMVPIIALNALLFYTAQLLTTPTLSGPAAHWTPRALAIAMAVEALALLLVLVLMYVVTTHRISAPYLHFKHTLDRVISGDVSARLAFRESDHMDDIALAFNSMLDRMTAARSGGASPAGSDVAPRK